MTILAWGSAGAPLAGEITSGDRAVVVPFPGGALVALIDGLGHGHEAGHAAKVAEDVLLAAPYAPLVDLVHRCHEELRRTRGAAMTIAQFDAANDTLSWIGVGNVEAILVRAGERGSDAVAMRGGTIGFKLPPLNPRTIQVEPGDTLVMATDGIQHGFKGEIVSSREPQQIADEILRGWSSLKDDALVIAARYVGGAEARRISIDGEGDVAHARLQTRELAEGVGLSSVAVEQLVTAVSELARNIVAHATCGEIVLVALDERPGVRIVARDLGPGIPDVEQAFEDGFTSTGSMGCGLSAARRLVDQIDVASRPGFGTVITIEKWLT